MTYQYQFAANGKIKFYKNKDGSSIKKSMLVQLKERFAREVGVSPEKVNYKAFKR